MALLNDSTLIGKRNFLYYYKQARVEAITSLNYKQGWAASRLWPIHIAKPLISRLLLKNSNKRDDNTPETSKDIKIPKWHNNNLVMEWGTPYKSIDIRQ